MKRNVFAISAAVVTSFVLSAVAHAADAKTAEKQPVAEKTTKKSETKKPKAKSKEVKKVNPNVVQVTLVTSKGTLKIELDKEKAPVTVENFVSYVKAGHYDKTIFHRVIDKFMIQGGGFDEKMTQKSTKSPIKTEASNGLKNVRGSLAMARTNDVNSATSQFFINLVDNSFLDYPTTVATRFLEKLSME